MLFSARNLLKTSELHFNPAKLSGLTLIADIVQSASGSTTVSCVKAAPTEVWFLVSDFNLPGESHTSEYFWIVSEDYDITNSIDAARMSLSYARARGYLKRM